MTRRKERKALAKWEDHTRQWAHEIARDLVMAMVRGESMPATPYRVGVVLQPGEHVWAECPVRFVQEGQLGTQAGPDWRPPTRPWLVTSQRIVGRLGDGRLYGWGWSQTTGCRVDLVDPVEFVALDFPDGSVVAWVGPGVAPLAVAAISHLHGPRALVDHPGLRCLRQVEQCGV